MLAVPSLSSEEQAPSKSTPDWVPKASLALRETEKVSI